MTDIILSSQLTSQSLSLSANTSFDAISGQGAIKSAYPISQNTVDIQPVGAVAYNQWFDLLLDRNNLHRDLFVILATGAGDATTTWSPYIGLCAFDNMELYSGSQKLYSCDPTLVNMRVLGSLPSKMQTLWLNSAGGATPSSAAAGVFVCPIVVPWSLANFPNSDFDGVFPAFLSAQDLRLRLHLRPQANLTSSTVISPSLAITCRQIISVVPASVKQELVVYASDKANDWGYTCKYYSTQSDANAVATATSATLNINYVTGNVSDIFAWFSTVANLSASPSNYTTIYPLTQSTLNLNGNNQLFQMSNYTSSDVINYATGLVSSFSGTSGVANQIYSCVFSANLYNDVISVFGYLNTGSIQTLTLQCQHASGGSSNLRLVYDLYGRIVLDNGAFIMLSN